MSQIQPKPRGGEAYIYVIAFSEGTVKVGFTTNPAKRLPYYRHAAACFGFTVVETWVSTPHLKARANERALIAWCAAHAVETRNSEYFVGLGPAQVITFADTLPMARHTDESFAEFEKVRQTRIEGATTAFSNVLQGELKRVFEPRSDGDLSADNPEHVWVTASLMELKLDSAREVLANPSLLEILTKALVRSLPMLQGEEEWPACNYEDGAVWATDNPMSEYWFETGMSLMHEFDRLGIPFNEQMRELLPPRPVAA